MAETTEERLTVLVEPKLLAKFEETLARFGQTRKFVVTNLIKHYIEEVKMVDAESIPTYFEKHGKFTTRRGESDNDWPKTRLRKGKNHSV